MIIGDLAGSELYYRLVRTFEENTFKTKDLEREINESKNVESILDVIHMIRKDHHPISGVYNYATYYKEFIEHKLK